MVGGLVIFALIAAFIVATSLRVVPQGEVFIRERLGREVGRLNPGLHFIVPFLDRTIRQKVGPDSASFQFGRVNISVVYEVNDAALLRSNVADFGAALKMSAEARLKKHLGENLDRVSAIDVSRAERELTRDMIDLFEPWGVRVRDVNLSLQ